LKSQTNRNKVAIVAPAIKTFFWKEFYDNLTKNDCKFEIIFVGHQTPNFTLPDNFHFIYSDKSPTHCASIAYSKAYETDCHYIQNVADDCLYQNNHFDKLIAAYEEQRRHDGDFLVCGPQSYNGNVKNVMALFPDIDHRDVQSRKNACIRAGGTEKHLGCRSEGPLLPTGNFSTIETSKKIGDIDLNFKALYWDCDLVMKLHSMNGKVAIFDSNKVSSVIERHNSMSRLYRMFGQLDYNYLVSKWDVRSTDGKTWNVTEKNLEGLT